MSVEKPLKKEATETCWCSILKNNRVQPFSRVDKEREAETECQLWEDISLDELETALKKTSNWKSPGPDVVPNVWPKQLTALHQHLLNAQNQAIENPENLPDWFTTTQTYLIPKNKDTENPENYRPISCLSTSYKKKCSNRFYPKEATPISQRIVHYRKNREVVSGIHMDAKINT